MSFDEGIEVKTCLLNHPGGSIGYRFDHDGNSVCYISDIEHSEPWPDPGLKTFIRDADLVIYDGMFSNEEYTRCQGWGHSTWQKGVELALAADVKALAIFHLFPGHDDITLRAWEAQMRQIDAHRLYRWERQSIAFPSGGGEAVADRSLAAKVAT